MAVLCGFGEIFGSYDPIKNFIPSLSYPHTYPQFIHKLLKQAIKFVLTRQKIDKKNKALRTAELKNFLTKSKYIIIIK